MNRRTLTLLGLAVVFATALPQTAFAQSSPLIGTWQLNLAKSTYSSGPPPRSGTATFQAEGQGLRGTVEGINAQGNPTKLVVMLFDDGKSYPATGNPAFDAQSNKRVNDSTWWAIRTKAGKVVQTVIIAVSADGKTATATNTGVNSNGGPQDAPHRLFPSSLAIPGIGQNTPRAGD
jgi:hypothetical protein